MLQKWNHWRMGFTINVWSLSAVLCHTPDDSQLPRSESDRMVADCGDIPGFVHTNTNCAALQEKLHECVGWFITSSTGVSDTTNCHIPVHPAIRK